MINKSKFRFRMGAISLIAMFLLIPLLSSPVVAAFTTISSVSTTNSAAGVPAVLITIPPPPYNNPDVAPRTATFNCNYNFVDAGSLSGSRHRATMTIVRTPGPNPAGSPASTGWIILGTGGSGGSAAGTLVITDTWTQGSSVSWQITLVGDCQDINSGNSVSVTRSYTVTVP